jgi:hypothetical protein
MKVETASAASEVFQGLEVSAVTATAGKGTEVRPVRSCHLGQHQGGWRTLISPCSPEVGIKSSSSGSPSFGESAPRARRAPAVVMVGIFREVKQSERVVLVGMEGVEECQ